MVTTLTQEVQLTIFKCEACTINYSAYTIRVKKIYPVMKDTYLMCPSCAYKHDNITYSVLSIYNVARK